MTQNIYRGGRHKKADPSTAFRCSVNFTDTERLKLIAMHEKSGVASLSSFIKMLIFGKTFKVHYIDDNTRVFINNLSDFSNRYRTIAVDYDQLVKTLRENFSEKKAMQILFKLEQQTIQLVKLNREIVALARRFDEEWLQKSH